MHTPQTDDRPRRRLRNRGALGLLVILLGFSAIQITVRYFQARHRRPDYRQQVAAMLVRWGLYPNGHPLPVDPAEIERQTELLKSGLSEERVRAAEWLASRGVRQAGGAIAQAMMSPGTERPCQLAHDLGYLGDDQWVPLLGRLTQGGSDDVRTCATLALAERASPAVVEALKEAYQQNVAPTTAIEGLGRVADPACLPFLRSVAASPRNELERKAAERAIGRIELMQRADPVAGLIDRVLESAKAGEIDTWAVRQLASQPEPRVTDALRRAYSICASNEDRVALAAALAAHGKPGRRVLACLVAASDGDAAEIARAGLAVSADVSAVATTAPAAASPGSRPAPLPADKP